MARTRILGCLRELPVLAWGGRSSKIDFPMAVTGLGIDEALIVIRVLETVTTATAFAHVPELWCFQSYKLAFAGDYVESWILTSQQWCRKHDQRPASILVQMRLGKPRYT